MTPIPFHHVVDGEGHESLTVFADNGPPIIVAGDHPNFAAIMAGAAEGAEPGDLRDLADASLAVAEHMEPLSERVSVLAGRVYFDGDELDTSLTAQIVRLIEAKSGDWPALVAFLEKLYTNPSDGAREQLYDWLRSRPFGITPEGDLIGYKGVDTADEDAEHDFESCWNGPGIVNGTPYNPDDGNGVPQSVGDIIELARSTVDPNAYVECSEGLHVGTFDFAQSYGDTLLKVIVNPRDVVGVPHGVSGSRKIRVCRYRVAEAYVEEPEAKPVAAVGGDFDHEPDASDEF